MRRKDGTICGAKTRPDGHPCLNPPTPGRERCRLHGGGQKRGIEHHNWKGGAIRSDRKEHPLRRDRLSTLLPKRLGDRFQAAAADPALLELDSDIALVDTRLEEILSQLETGEAGAAWDRVQRAFTAYCISQTPPAFAALEDAIEAGASERERWAEVIELVDQRRKLVESQRKRLVEMKQMLLAEEAVNLMATLAAAVRRHVTDPAALEAINAEFEVLANLPGGADANG